MAESPLASRSVTTQPLTFVTASAGDLARELCAIDTDLFSKVTPKEILAWSRSSSDRSGSPNVVKVIAHFNALSLWAATAIVSETSLKGRARIVTKMLAVMRQLKQMHNFNALMALLAGINCSAVFRLKHTFAQLSTRSQAQL